MRIVALLLIVAVVIVVIWMRARRTRGRIVVCAALAWLSPLVVLAGIAQPSRCTRRARSRPASATSSTASCRRPTSTACTASRSMRKTCCMPAASSVTASIESTPRRARSRASSARPKAWPTTWCFSPTARSCGRRSSTVSCALAKATARSPSSPISSASTRSTCARTAGCSRRRCSAATALWEIDPAGAKPPRLILKDLGGFNGFDIGPDGKLYGPLWFKHQVVRIDPDSGKLDVVADGFDTPAAANFDSQLEPLRARHGARRSRARRHPQRQEAGRREARDCARQSRDRFARPRVRLEHGGQRHPGSRRDQRHGAPGRQRRARDSARHRRGCRRHAGHALRRGCVRTAHASIAAGAR